MKPIALHLIAFNVPFPANYGGVIEVYYKLIALQKLGVQVHLHCFQYGRSTAPILENVCASVRYYPRKTGLLKQFSLLPYIVTSRAAKNLLKTLLKDDLPILFEGLHTCAFLNHPQLKNRLKLVRMHNIEWQYYAHLASLEKHFIKKAFFKIESWRLKRFENRLTTAAHFLPISPLEASYFRQHFPKNPQTYLSAFHPNETFSVKEGKGDFALFHGDLSVKDNEQAVLFLIEKVFADLPDFKFVIAGRQPSEKLKKQVKRFANILLKADVASAEMNQLLREAQVHILLSFQSAGMKLKLLESLYCGRFIIVNSPMIKGTGLEQLCFVGDDSDTLKKHLNAIKTQVFTSVNLSERTAFLTQFASNTMNAQKIIKLLKDN